VDVDAYRAEAEAFSEALNREYLLHFSGRQEGFEIEPIYERHAALFEREAVERLREAGNRELLRFAVEGHIEQAVKEESGELARREAALEVEVDGERMPFRRSPVAQANEPDPDRRAAHEDARLELTARELDPLMRSSLERGHALARELGWPHMRAMCEELTGIDLAALERHTRAFLEATADSYPALLAPQVERHLGTGLDRLRRSDLPALFRAPELDVSFPAKRLLGSLEATLAGLGLDGEAASRVQIDAEDRPNKSPRAFCSTVRIPEEVHLVIARIGGRDDYEALLHEAGHAEHYAHTDAGLPFEDRHLGDNSVTESFAFLFQHLATDRGWLREHLSAAGADELVEYARAVRLVYMRRYAAKLAYELELHAADSLDEMPARYAEHLSAAVGVDWPTGSWLADVDPFFYAARYLRAWALEPHLSRLLRERFGERWWAEPRAGALLVETWRSGQRLDADDLLAELTGAELDFSALAEEFIA
jgi:hypothetical protein